MQERFEPKTTEEWQNYAKELRGRIRKLEKKQADLVLKLSQRNDLHEKNIKSQVMSFSVTFMHRLVTVQKIWRGHKARKEYLKKLEDAQHSSHARQTQFSTNEVILQDIYKAAKALGLTLEMLYRACDKDYSGIVYLEDFRTFLRKLKLNVPRSHIARFLYVVDEECTGLIRRQEYQEALASYSVSTERHVERSATGSRTYEQECLLKFAYILKKSKKSPAEVFAACDSEETSKLKSRQLLDYLIKSFEELQLKEAHALINYFDVDQVQVISEQFFIDEVSRAMQIAEQEGPIEEHLGRSFNLTGSNLVSRPGTSGAGQRSKGSSNMKSFGFKVVEEGVGTQSMGPRRTGGRTSTGFSIADEDVATEAMQEQDKEKSLEKDKSMSSDEADAKEIRMIVAKMDKSRIQVYQFVEEFLLSVKDVHQGISVGDMNRLLSDYYDNVLTKAERAKLLKHLNSNFDGVVDIIEAKDFLLSYSATMKKDKVLSLRLMVILLAKKLEYERVSTKEYLHSKNINLDEECPMTQFSDVMALEFELTPAEVMELFSELKEMETGNCDLMRFIRTVSSFRSDELDKQTLDEARTGAHKHDTKEEEIIGHKPAIEINTQKNPNPKLSREMNNVSTFKRIIIKMELNKFPLRTLLEEILYELKNPHRGVAIGVINCKLDQECGYFLTVEERVILIEELDSNMNGSLDLHEVRAFLAKWSQLSKERIFSLTVLMLLLSRQLQAEKMTTSDFLKSIRLDTSKKFIPLKNVVAEFARYFRLEKEDAVEVFNELDMNNTETVDTELFVKRIDSYRTQTKSIFQNTVQVNSHDTEVRRQVQEGIVQKLRRILRAYNIDPYAVFKKSCKPGQDFANILHFKQILEEVIPAYSTKDLVEALRIMDVNGNGYLSSHEFQIVFLDDEDVTRLGPRLNSPGSQHAPNRETAQSRQLLEQFKKCLEESALTPEEFFTLADRNKDSQVTLYELKAAVLSYVSSTVFSIGNIKMNGGSLITAFDSRYCEASGAHRLQQEQPHK